MHVAMKTVNRLFPMFVLPTLAACSPQSSLPETSGGQEGTPMDLSAAVMSPEATQVAKDENSLNLVAQIGLAGRVIKFFEPKQGLLLQIERGVAAQARLD